MSSDYSPYDDDGIILEKAIISIISGQDIAEANNYVVKFIESDDSWIGSMACIHRSPDDSAVKYFAANLLYSKVTGVN